MATEAEALQRFSSRSYLIFRNHRGRKGHTFALYCLLPLVERTGMKLIVVPRVPITVIRGTCIGSGLALSSILPSSLVPIPLLKRTGMKLMILPKCL